MGSFIRRFEFSSIKYCTGKDNMRILVCFIKNKEWWEREGPNRRSAEGNAEACFM